MIPLKTIKIRSYEKGLLFRNDEFDSVLSTGRHWIFNPDGKIRVERASQRDPWLMHEKLDMIVKSGALEGLARVVDLKDHERALVWIDGRFDRILTPGLYALWTGIRDVKVELVDAREVRFEHPDINVIAKSRLADEALDIAVVENGRKCVYFKDGKYVETLDPGKYAFWKNTAKVKLFHIDMRECTVDVAGQEIMTSDKVTLRLNAVVVYKIVDALKSVVVSEDARQALYREAQLALRAVIGTAELDAMLSDKDAVASQLLEILSRRAPELGIQVISLGIRDIILPGEMKDLMNKVTEAKKASEANLIVRREETAAMRSQLNTAKLFENNPGLMRLRELEVLEKIAQTSKLNIVLGEKGLTDSIVNLL